MSEAPDPEVTRAYTRQAVDEYLRGVAAQRSELEAAMAHARRRRARAVELEQRLVSLEQRVGQSFVTAHAHARAVTGGAGSPGATITGDGRSIAGDDG